MQKDLFGIISPREASFLLGRIGLLGFMIVVVPIDGHETNNHLRIDQKGAGDKLEMLGLVTNDELTKQVQIICGLIYSYLDM